MLAPGVGCAGTSGCWARRVFIRRGKQTPWLKSNPVQTGFCTAAPWGTGDKQQSPVHDKVHPGMCIPDREQQQSSTNWAHSRDCFNLESSGAF